MGQQNRIEKWNEVSCVSCIDSYWKIIRNYVWLCALCVTNSLKQYIP